MRTYAVSCGTRPRGHHVPCACRMGRADGPSAVVDSGFGGRGAERPRIAGAPVFLFPRVPGFFVAVPVYVISEKASEVIPAAPARA
ncbi:GMC oxidoreductase [Streptomyces sp. NPDC052020]|uniref:GMC oxidoreductase n=1 Tax=Streptomyces sp. NPDC052020 TaxID=3155677 RepID=UPI003440B53A